MSYYAGVALAIAGVVGLRRCMSYYGAGADLAIAVVVGLLFSCSSSAEAQYAGLTTEPQVRAVFKTAVAYPRRMKPSEPVSVRVAYRFGGGGEAAHAEQTRKWV